MPLYFFSVFGYNKIKFRFNINNKIMPNFLKPLEKKINGIIRILIFTGIIFLFLAVLIVWSPIVSRLTLGFFIILLAALFFYGAHKIWSIKKEVNKLLKF